MKLRGLNSWSEILKPRLKAGRMYKLMEPVVSKTHSLLIKRHKTVSVAESCTGGLLSKLLTDSSGSSKYFILGLVTYSNTAKESILNIPSLLISKKGAVSKEVAQKMAESVRILAKTDFGIAITGIAGPTGAIFKKPQGTVFIAIGSKSDRICKRFLFRGNRSAVRTKAALKSLELLKRLL